MQNTLFFVLYIYWFFIMSFLMFTVTFVLCEVEIKMLSIISSSIKKRSGCVGTCLLHFIKAISLLIVEIMEMSQWLNEVVTNQGLLLSISLYYLFTEIMTDGKNLNASVTYIFYSSWLLQNLLIAYAVFFTVLFC